MTAHFKKYRESYGNYLTDKKTAMFVHYRTAGLFIKKIDKGEADQLFTVYTEDFGRLEILAKGIKKMASKLRSQAEIFYLARIEFIQGKTYRTLTDSIAVEKFKDIRSDPEKFEAAAEIGGLVDSLVLGQEKDPKIWNLLLKTFHFLNGAKTADPENAYRHFFWNLLSELGYRPELYRCCFCKKKLAPGDLRFRPGEGGISCSRCLKAGEAGIPVDPETIKIIRIFLDRDLKTASRLVIPSNQKNKLEAVSKAYLSTII